VTTRANVHPVRFGLAEAMLIVGVFAALFACSRSLGIRGLLGSLAVGACVGVIITTSGAFCRVFTLTAVAWTTLLIAFAAWDQGWGALAIAFIFGPGVNAVAALLGIIFVAAQRFRDHSFPLVGPLATVISVPFGSGLLIFGAVYNMPLRGC
jgi:hypothetical protein